MSTRFTSFKSDVASEVKHRRWFLGRGIVPLVLAALLFIGLAIGCLARRGLALAPRVCAAGATSC